MSCRHGGLGGRWDGAGGAEEWVINMMEEQEDGGGRLVECWPCHLQKTLPAEHVPWNTHMALHAVAVHRRRPGLGCGTMRACPPASAPHLAFPQVVKDVVDIGGACHGVVCILLVNVNIVNAAAPCVGAVLLLLR